MQITEVYSPSQIITVSQLADEIWKEHYPPIIGHKQVEYMLESFQNPKAILAQINEGYRYFLLSYEEVLIGYIAVRQKGNSLFVSKFYIKKDARKKGYARSALVFLKKLAKEEGLLSLSLTVNIHNTAAIKAYTALGFINTGTLVQEIGEDYVMDDYTFEIQC